VFYISSARDETTKSEEERSLLLFFFVSREEKTFRMTMKGRKKKARRTNEKIYMSICDVSLSFSLCILQGCALKLYVCVCVCVCVFNMVLCVTCRARIANLSAEDSCYRGGIVNILGVFSCKQDLQSKGGIRVVR